MGLIVPLLSYKNGFGIKKPMKVDMPLIKEAQLIQFIWILRNNYHRDFVIFLKK